jgi:hypothetical protein
VIDPRAAADRGAASIAPELADPIDDCASYRRSRAAAIRVDSTSHEPRRAVGEPMAARPP